MTIKHYYSWMKDPLSGLMSAIGGVFGSGVSATLLHIDLHQILGMLYFLLTSFTGGLVGFLAKKFGDYCWKTFFKPKTSTNERSDQDGSEGGG